MIMQGAFERIKLLFIAASLKYFCEFSHILKSKENKGKFKITKRFFAVTWLRNG